ncbi:thioesterase family protein [Gammaproteobacteria bacterium]|nr:thioesterase family protein [Gammaproteobacteria bacterium]
MSENLQNSFPYQADLVEITEEMCDLNGHMNVLYYNQMLGFAFGDFYSLDMGFSDEYFDSGFSSFTLEDNYKYMKECLLGEKLLPRYRLHNVNKKLLHIAGVLINESGDVCALYETVLGHIDMNSRKTSEMEDGFLNNLFSIMKDNTKHPVDMELRLKIKDLT